MAKKKGFVKAMVLTFVYEAIYFTSLYVWYLYPNFWPYIVAMVIAGSFYLINHPIYIYYEARWGSVRTVPWRDLKFELLRGN